MLATVVSLLGATAAIPMVVSGTASAQTNSRICGREFVTNANSKFKEKVFLIYEVPKEGSAECNQAKSENPLGSGKRENPLFGPFKVKETAGIFWETTGVDHVVCEDFTSDLVGDPARNIEFIGDNFPANKDKKDICHNMNRSDTIFEMEAYWLYLSNYESNHAEGPWKFQRG